MVDVEKMRPHLNFTRALFLTREEFGIRHMPQGVDQIRVVVKKDQIVAVLRYEKPRDSSPRKSPQEVEIKKGRFRRGVPIFRVQGCGIIEPITSTRFWYKNDVRAYGEAAESFGKTTREFFAKVSRLANPRLTFPYKHIYAGIKAESTTIDLGKWVAHDESLLRGHVKAEDFSQIDFYLAIGTGCLEEPLFLPLETLPEAPATE